MGALGILLIPIAIVVLVVVGIAEDRKRKRRLAWEREMVAEGKAGYYVKVAASGRGTVYHHPSCGRCRSKRLKRIEGAEAAAYLPCSVCGGSPQFYLNSELDRVS